MIMAELERIAISGANAGKQRTYAAFDERVPPSPPRPRDEALAELAARFIASRGPASERDFAAWSGFTLGDTRTGVRGCRRSGRAGGGRIERIEVDGTPHVFDAASVDTSSGRTPDAAGHDVVDLLQAYDEYIMGYAPPRSYLLPAGRSDPVRPEFPLHAIAVDGVMAGRWAPVVEAKRARVRIVPWRDVHGRRGTLARGIRRRGGAVPRPPGGRRSRADRRALTAARNGGAHHVRLGRRCPFGSSRIRLT